MDTDNRTMHTDGFLGFLSVGICVYTFGRLSASPWEINLGFTDGHG